MDTYSMGYITVVTGNAGKFLEINDILSRFGIGSVQADTETAEEGMTLEERCLSKAVSAFQKVKKPLIVDDTGLFLSAFQNWPGPFSKKVFAELGIEGIMKRLEGRDRGACFRSVVCYVDGNGTRLFDGMIRGKISETVHEGGHDSLPYDRIFVPEGYEVPFCMIPESEKNSVSHRAKAVESFAKWFCQKSQTAE